MTAPRSRLSALVLAGAVVCLVACAAYASTLTGYFLNDDFGVVALLSAKPATYFPRWFVTSWMDTIWGFNPDEVRPFPAVSYQLTAWPNPASPVAHHLLNVAIHAANGVLVVLLARAAIGLPLVAATLAGLVFVLLPVQAESVAWITGRVDSLPTFFYLGAVLVYIRWRQESRRSGSSVVPQRASAALYLCAVLLGFMAIFTKQNTITLAAALLGYDVLIDRRWSRSLWSWIWPYLPFAAITIGYMWLRYLLFGQVVRESLLTASGMTYAVGVIERHAWRTIVGHPEPAFVELALLALIGLVVLYCAMRTGARAVPRPWGSVAYFVAGWWLLGVAPVLVAGYESPRHVYLASIAWAVLVAMAFQWTWTMARSRGMRALVLVTTVAVIGVYAVRLSIVVGDWNRRAHVSAQAARDLAREALAAPEGSLLIVGASGSWWEWALPFVAQPPFVATDLTSRVFVISPRVLHCCRDQWEADTRRTLDAWRARGGTSVIAMRWNEQTAELLRASDRDDPEWRSLALYLSQVPSRDDVDRIMTDALQRRLAR